MDVFDSLGSWWVDVEAMTAPVGVEAITAPVEVEVTTDGVGECDL